MLGGLAYNRQYHESEGIAYNSDETYEIEIEWKLGHSCSDAPNETRLLATVVADWSHPLGNLSADPAADYGCTLWNIFTYIHADDGQCTLGVDLLDKERCNGQINTGLQYVWGWPRTLGKTSARYLKGDFTIPDFAAATTHTLQIKVNQTGFDCSSVPISGDAFIPFTDCTRYNVIWDGERKTVRDAAQSAAAVDGSVSTYEDLVAPTTFVQQTSFSLPEYLYAAYCRATDGICNTNLRASGQIYGSDMMAKFLYGPDILSRRRRRNLQTTTTDPPTPPPPTPLPPESNLGPLEIWGSDVSSFFGTRLAVLPNGVSSTHERVRIDADLPYRYLSLRSYSPDARLRLDSLRFFGETQTGTGASPSLPPVMVNSPPPSASPGVDVALSEGRDSVSLGNLYGQVMGPTLAAPYIAPGLEFTPSSGSSSSSSSNSNNYFRPYYGRKLDEVPVSSPKELAAISELFADVLNYTTPITSSEHAFAILQHAIVKHVGDDHPMANRSNWPVPQKTFQERINGIEYEIETDLFDVDDGANWWNHVEIVDLTHSAGLFGLYPLRLANGMSARTPAASLAVAMALANRSSANNVSSLPTAETTLVDTSCAVVGCAFSRLEYPILHQSMDAWFFATSSSRDDQMIAVWLLSTAVAPAIRRIVDKALFCASASLCKELCELCSGLPHANSSAEAVLRATEEAFVWSSDRQQSTNPLECSQSAGCIASVAERAAARLGTIAFPDADGFGTIASANSDLFAFVREHIAANESFQSGTEMRLDVVRKHYDELTKLFPLAEYDDGDADRLADEAPEDDDGVDHVFVAWFRNLTANEKRMHLVTSTTRDHVLKGADFESISAAHMQAVRAWAQSGGGIGHGPNNTGVCADPHFPNRTISCRKYFSLMAMILKRMRNARDVKHKTGADAPDRRKLTESSHKELTEHVEKALDQTCCAKFESDGRVECGKQYCEHHAAQQTAKRAAHMLRRMESTPSDRTKTHKPLTPDVHAVIENIILPETHSDPECRVVNRSSLAHGGPTRWECMGKSFVHHASKRYGFDAETVKNTMEKAGFSVGESMQSFQRAAGMFREIRSSGDVRRKKQGRRASSKSAASKTARELLAKYPDPVGRQLSEDDAMSATSDEDEAMRLTVTRGTTRSGKRRTHGFAHAAKTIAEKRNVDRNVSSMLKAHFQRVESVQHSDRLRRSAAGSRATRFDKTPRAAHFHYDNLRQHFFSPSLSFQVLNADEGSLASRFKGAATHLGDLFVQWQGVHYTANLVDVRRRRARERRLSEDGQSETERTKTAMGLYDELERQEKQRHKNRVEALSRTEHGRRMSEDELHQQTRANHFEIPANHRLSWVHELVDWEALADEWTRLHDIFSKRDEARMHGRSMKDILHSHQTGYSLLDDHTKFGFSKVGDAIRRLWHRKTNGSDVGFVEHTRSKDDRAGKHVPEGRGHHVRRLAESFLGPVVRAPYALFDTVLFRGTYREYVAPRATENIFVSALRYVVFSTVGCYLVKPSEFAVSSQNDDPENPGAATDGAQIKVLRVDSARFCFPAIPFVIPTLPTWREFTKSEGIDYEILTYEVCAHCTAPRPWPSYAHAHAPRGVLLRRSTAHRRATSRQLETSSSSFWVSTSSRRPHAGSAFRAFCAAPRR